MNDHLVLDEWRIIEKGFHPENNRVMESLFSLGNGRIGIRGSFEETFSGNTLPGSYFGGICYPVLSAKKVTDYGPSGAPMQRPDAANWIGITVEFDGEELDLATCELKSFSRILDMRSGTLERQFKARLASGKEVLVRCLRFISLSRKELGLIQYAITPLNFSGTLTLTPFLNLNGGTLIQEERSKAWVEVETQVKRNGAYLLSETKKTEFQVCTSMKFELYRNGQCIDFNSYRIQREKYVACSVDLPCKEEQETVLHKYVALPTSLDYPKEVLVEKSKSILKTACKLGFDHLLEEHKSAWTARWKRSDIVIKGDIAMQQGIRFNLFHLLQAYDGTDQRLNLNPGGFTGVRNGGCTSWSTEMFGLPFYLGNLGAEAARNMLMYRYDHLPQAIAYAEQLGFVDGAAFYPIGTINGGEGKNEGGRELEAVHRNGAIAYAIYDYVRNTGDREFLIQQGLEMLIAIARFWSQRVHYSEQRKRYVIHGVTGPNEYENNVNNNWYTNYLAAWSLRYAMDVWKWMREKAPEKLRQLIGKIKFYEFTETNRWQRIIDKMYLPWDEKRGIFLQQDGYLDKQFTIPVLPDDKQRPLYRHWTRDRILRSPYLQRADVLQGLFLFEDDFDEGAIQRNVAFYEPLTVHESALSPGIHAVLAVRTGAIKMAYQYLLQSVRCDLDDLLQNTDQGCHVTGMAGTWMAIVKGFAGMKIIDEKLHLSPILPEQWTRYSFQMQFRHRHLEVQVSRSGVALKNHSSKSLKLKVYGKAAVLPGKERLHFSLPD